MIYQTLSHVLHLIYKTLSQVIYRTFTENLTVFYRAYTEDCLQLGSDNNGFPYIGIRWCFGVSHALRINKFDKYPCR